MKFLLNQKKNYGAMGNYKLSEDAKTDLIRIHQRGVREHGQTQADKYYMAFLIVLNNWQNSRICIKPLMIFAKATDVACVAWIASITALTAIPSRS